MNTKFCLVIVVIIMSPLGMILYQNSIHDQVLQNNINKNMHLLSIEDQPFVDVDAINSIFQQVEEEIDYSVQDDETRTITRYVDLWFMYDEAAKDDFENGRLYFMDFDEVCEDIVDALNYFEDQYWPNKDIIFCWDHTWKNYDANGPRDNQGLPNNDPSYSYQGDSFSSYCVYWAYQWWWTHQVANDWTNYGRYEDKIGDFDAHGSYHDILVMFTGETDLTPTEAAGCAWIQGNIVLIRTTSCAMWGSTLHQDTGWSWGFYPIWGYLGAWTTVAHEICHNYGVEDTLYSYDLMDYQALLYNAPFPYSSTLCQSNQDVMGPNLFKHSR
jgi:hypothetical protein